MKTFSFEDHSRDVLLLWHMEKILGKPPWHGEIQKWYAASDVQHFPNGKDVPSDGNSKW